MARFLLMWVLYASGTWMATHYGPSIAQVTGILLLSYASCQFGKILGHMEASKEWDGEGLEDRCNILPRIGQDVLFHMGSSDSWEPYTVTGYYVWGDLGGNPRLHRVFVRGISTDGIPNARMLGDIRYPEKKS